MFIGAAVGGVWNKPEEERLFYQGYGPTRIDRVALDYYRCERIVVDIVEYCDALLGSTAGGRDRERGLGNFIAQFEPGDVVEVALRG